MQSLFTLETNEFSTPKEAEKHLRQSIQNYFDFFHYIIYTAYKVGNYVATDAEIKSSKLLSTDAERQVSIKYFESIIQTNLSIHEEFQKIIEKKKFDNLVEQHVIQALYNDLTALDVYQTYINNPLTDEKDDFAIFKALIFEVLLPSELFVEHLGDLFVNRDDDGLDVERALVKAVSKAKKKKNVGELVAVSLLKRSELEKFATELFNKTLQNKEFLTEEFSAYLTNWDSSRLALVDTLLIQMALCEMLYFEEIPLKVTMNEYIDISKEYSTPKSKEFINGVLDKMMKNYKETGRIVKTGRGLKD